MEEIRLARVFGRWDVDQWLSEITPDQLVEQAAYDDVVAERQREAEKAMLRSAARRAKR